MKTNIVIVVLILFTFLELSFKKFTNKTFQNKICVRVANNSQYELSEVSLFSLTFGNIGLGKKSKYKVLKFDRKRDNQIIQLTANNTRFALYVTADSTKGNYTYVIDSITVAKRYIHIHKVKNQ